ncbi:hypothetical protein FBEOM_3804 [Fusarium beomiforme]|uniref:Transcription factor n=1 Tax=Fusarium beomiforme TaxID=44412 RepID=A0A9P5DYQ0_9HYPO|nr:hypothetical protein FBEOM_3804 [Fusarium beomiforme]
MATDTQQLAYTQPTEAVNTEVLSSPPTPWATYSDLPEPPRTTFTEHIPYFQSPVPAYMELLASPPTPMATDTEQLACSQPTEAINTEVLSSPPSPWATYADSDLEADTSPASCLLDECNHCGCSDIDDDRAPYLPDEEFRRSERSFSAVGNLEDDVFFNSSPPIISSNLGSPAKPQETPDVSGIPTLSESPCRGGVVHVETHSTPTAMNSQALEALYMLQLCLIFHATASARKPNIGLNRRIASESTDSPLLDLNITGTVGTTTHRIAGAKGLQAQRSNVESGSQKRKFQTRFNKEDDTRSKKEKWKNA